MLVPVLRAALDQLHEDRDAEDTEDQKRNKSHPDREEGKGLQVAETRDSRTNPATQPGSLGCPDMRI